MPHHQDDVTGAPTTDAHLLSGPISLGFEIGLVLANILPLCVVWRVKKGRERSPTDELIAALSVTDILSVIIPSPLGFTSYFRHEWWGGRITCDIYQVSSVWFQLASMCLVTFMCLDRWVALVQATKFKAATLSSVGNSGGHRRVRYAVGVIYMLTLGVACLPLMGLAPEALSRSGRLCQSWVVSHPASSKQHVFYLSFLTLGCANLLFAVVINVTIVAYLWRFHRQFGARSADRVSSAALQIDRRNTVDFTVMILVVTLVYYMAWLPALVMICLQRVGIWVSDASVLYAVLSTTLTGLLNPLIYAVFSRQYRSGYFRLLTGLSKLLFGCPLSRIDVINDVTSQAKRLRGSNGSTCNSIAALLSSKDDSPGGAASGVSNLAEVCYSPSGESQRSLLNSKHNSVYDFQEPEQGEADESAAGIDMHDRTYLDEIMQKESNMERMSKDIYGSNLSLLSDTDTCDDCSVGSTDSRTLQTAVRHKSMQESII